MKNDDPLAKQFLLVVCRFENEYPAKKHCNDRSLCPVTKLALFVVLWVVLQSWRGFCSLAAVLFSPSRTANNICTGAPSSIT